MKTYPIRRADGSLSAFEISSMWIIFRPLYRILRSVPEVANVKRNWFQEDRISFTFEDIPYVVHEDWGDSSRYWIGPSSPETHVNLEPLHKAFKGYNRLDILGVSIVRDDG
jgi:hypothetical protein